MKVLLVTTSDTFYNSDSISKTNSYNGVGWVASQQLYMMERGVCELAVMFPTSDISADNRMVDGVAYYPIIDSPGKLTRLKRYYFPSRDNYFERVSHQVKRAVDDFRPDIIHVFGLECPLSEIVYDSNVPCIVHLQGILSACEKSFFPPGIGVEEVRRNGLFLREIIYRNGFIHGYDVMKRRVVRERKLFKTYSYFLGRTEWDKDITNIYSNPDATYYHVNEILRPEFYNATVREPRKEIDCLKIVSTISQTLYKGLDMVLKTANELECLGLSYKWTIIGIGANSEYEHIVCKSLDIEVPKSVTFVGIKNAGEIVEILKDSDVYFHPSYIDNSPNSLCEAQILGVPVIATNVGGVSSIIRDKETGILVQTNEPDMAAFHLKVMSENYNMRCNLSKAAYDCAVKRHDPEKIVSAIFEVYNHLVKDER